MDNQSRLSAEDNLLKAEITESSNGTATAERTLEIATNNSNGHASNERSNITEFPVSEFADPNISADANMKNSTYSAENPEQTLGTTTAPQPLPPNQDPYLTPNPNLSNQTAQIVVQPLPQIKIHI